MRNSRLNYLLSAQAITIFACISGPGFAEVCSAPPRPFLPNDSQATRDYADIIQRDFEDYIRDIQSHFRCLDDERARAFEEAREVSEAFGRFLRMVRD